MSDDLAALEASLGVIAAASAVWASVGEEWVIAGFLGAVAIWIGTSIWDEWRGS